MGQSVTTKSVPSFNGEWENYNHALLLGQPLTTKTERNQNIRKSSKNCQKFVHTQHFGHDISESYGFNLYPTDIFSALLPVEFYFPYVIFL